METPTRTQKSVNPRIRDGQGTERQNECPFRNDFQVWIPVPFVTIIFHRFSRCKGQFCVLRGKIMVTDQKKDILPNVLNHEPHMALFTPNNDPIYFYRLIINFASKKFELLFPIFSLTTLIDFLISIELTSFFTMNLKERGITVGDLLIILILSLTTTMLVKSFNKDKKTTLNFSLQERVSCNQSFYQNLI